MTAESIIQMRESRIKGVDDGRPVHLLVPSGFDPGDVLSGGLRPYGERALYLLHLILTRRLIRRREAESWGVPLKSEYLRNVIGKGYADGIKRAMIDGGVIVERRDWVAGVRSIAYDLDWSRFAGTRLEWAEVRDATLRRNMLAQRRERQAPTSDTRRRLVGKLGEFGVAGAVVRDVLGGLSPGPGDDPVRFEGWRASCETVLRFMEHEDRGERCFVARDDHGRLHHCLGNAPSGLRGYFDHDGKPLVNVDVACSQPLIAGSVIRDRFGKNPPKDVGEYIEACEAGQFYEALMARAGIDKGRDDFKRDVFVVFYGEVHHMRGPVADAFRELFPNVVKAIREDKAEHGHAALARRMQGRESQTMIDGDGGILAGAAARFMAEAPEAPLVTIHDALQTTAEYVGLAERAIFQEYAALGIRPTVKTQPCERRLAPRRAVGRRKARNA